MGRQGFPVQVAGHTLWRYVSDSEGDDQDDKDLVQDPPAAGPSRQRHHSLHAPPDKLINLFHPGHVGRLLLYTDKACNALETSVHDIRSTLRKLPGASSDASLFWLYKRPASRFIVVGEVLAITQEKTMRTTYLVDDGTGTIFVQHAHRRVIKNSCAHKARKERESKLTKAWPGRASLESLKKPSAALGQSSASVKRVSEVHLSEKARGKQRVIDNGNTHQLASADAAVYTPVSYTYSMLDSEGKLCTVVQGDGTYDLFQSPGKRVPPDDGRVPDVYRWPSFNDLMDQFLNKGKDRGAKSLRFAPTEADEDGSAMGKKVKESLEALEYEYVPAISEDEVQVGDLVRVEGSIRTFWKERIIAAANGEAGIRILQDPNALTRHINRWYSASMPGGAYHQAIKLSDLPTAAPIPDPSAAGRCEPGFAPDDNAPSAANRTVNMMLAGERMRLQREQGKGLFQKMTEAFKALERGEPLTIPTATKARETEVPVAAHVAVGTAGLPSKVGDAHSEGKERQSPGAVRQLEPKPKSSFYNRLPESARAKMQSRLETFKQLEASLNAGTAHLPTLLDFGDRENGKDLNATPFAHRHNSVVTNNPTEGAATSEQAWSSHSVDTLQSSRRRSLKKKDSDEENRAPGAAQQAGSQQPSASESSSPQLVSIAWKGNKMAVPAPRKQPKLEDPVKLSRKHLNSDTVELYTQEWLRRHCALPSSLPPNMPSTKDQDMWQLPPAFTVRYLRRVPRLRTLVRRFVKHEMQKRAAKVDGAKSTSRESVGTKMRRVFDWVIRVLWQKGFIVLAGEADAARMTPPWDGQKVDRGQQCSRRTASASLSLSSWGGTTAEMFAPESPSSRRKHRAVDHGDIVKPLSTGAPASSASIGLMTVDGPSLQRTLSSSSIDVVEVSDESSSSDGDDDDGGKQQQKVFQLVTPALIFQSIEPLAAARGASDEVQNARMQMTMTDPAELTYRLRNSDLRWKHVKAESVYMALDIFKRY
ncbi:hypothetical protein K437DRAFT_275057 [Tilletiaria anomala UBC 951]|uniref:CST complex subunit Stn1 N-terminal domain-containing protein n=1 Tax=Tilletiaria anomala (strain ATCC 24038 / CBS 436.72 / UBC 951) TaxID=1037660 RepID=A0A066VVR0_TILAU|nr:uncharacterized protein K437DRAFT_275057 [Tilletiaria anomala UBC 951]KDN42874.1 hypothetical protein K437DRAFT_275057 [Tilletiaria anomala UBC 951]